MQLLNNTQVSQKIKRLAIEIIESNYNEEEIFLAGINNNGYHFAKLLIGYLRRKSPHIKFYLCRINLSPADPLSKEVKFSIPVEELEGKVVIIVDDVANTGRTIFYAFKPLMSVIPKKIEAAVLVDRKHKTFPVQVDYVGISLATTLEENINVDIQNNKEKGVVLE